jgi:hypothetical protein
LNQTICSCSGGYFKGELLNHALDDNIILANGDTISRININDDFETAKLNIENYLIEKIK